MIFQVFRDLVPVLTSGVVTVVLSSCALFGIQTHCGFAPGLLGVGASVLQSGHVHGLLAYPFHHRSLAQLLPSAAALALLGGSLEKGVGTVRFLLLFPLLSATTGLLYSVLDLLQAGGGRGRTEGLLPAALACVALTTVHAKTTKGFLCGVSFPAAALPWVLLVVTTALVPHSVLSCNVIAVLVGWMYGKGWFSPLDVSEARAGVLEKTLPFRLLRSVSGVMFVPASAEERRRTLLPQISPTPGSYPVQAYAPLSGVHSADATGRFHEGWQNSAGALPGPGPGPALSPALSPHGHAHGCGPSHGHCSEQSFGHGHSHG